MNADDLFQELGYAIEQHKSYVKYYDGQCYIWFDYNYRDIEITASIGVNELKAINKKVEELGWNK